MINEKENHKNQTCDEKTSKKEVREEDKEASCSRQPGNMQEKKSII